HVHLFLRLVRVSVGKAIAGRDTLVAESGFLELERPGRRAELQVGRAVELGADVLQIVLDVPERERHGRSYSVRQWRAISARAVTPPPSRERTWSRNRSSARARPGRPTIRQCRPTFIIRPPSSYSCSNVSTRYV